MPPLGDEDVTDEALAKFGLIIKAIESETDDRGLFFIEAFRALPTRKELPLYYQLIKRPVDVKRMRDRIRKGQCVFFMFPPAQPFRYLIM
jgi:hypothetical protein